MRHVYPIFFFMLLCLTASTAFAQEGRSIRVSGTVLKASDKTPLPGIGIIILGTNDGTVTDERGLFSINIKTTDTLMVRGIGLRTIVYIPTMTTVNELRVRFLMEEENVELPAVEVSGRPTKEQIDRALRNMKPRPAPAPPRPNPTVVIKPANPDAPPAQPTISNPASFLYDKFSKEGKQKEKLNEIMEEKAIEDHLKTQQDYNRFFKDNTGYE